MKIIKESRIILRFLLEQGKEKFALTGGREDCKRSRFGRGGVRSSVLDVQVSGTY